MYVKTIDNEMEKCGWVLKLKKIILYIYQCLFNSLTTYLLCILSMRYNKCNLFL